MQESSSNSPYADVRHVGVLHSLINPQRKLNHTIHPDWKKGQGFTFIIGYKPASAWHLCHHGGCPISQEGQSGSQIHPRQILEEEGWMDEWQCLCFGKWMVVLLHLLFLVFLHDPIPLSLLLLQVINNNLSINHSLKLTGKPCSYQALKKRVNHHH